MQRERTCDVTAVQRTAEQFQFWHTIRNSTKHKVNHKEERDKRQQTTALSDHFVRAEPKGIYDLPAQSQLDGVAQLFAPPVFRVYQLFAGPKSLRT